MNPADFYLERVKEYKQKIERLQGSSNRLSLFRLAVFFGGVILFVSLSSVSVTAAVSVFCCALVIFIWLVIRYEKNEKHKKFCQHLERINTLELRSLDGDFSEYREGSGYIDHDHPFSYDLDIFGHSSLFQYICRATSKPAADLLAEYLKYPAPVEEILLRQEAVEELKDQTEWRQHLMTHGFDTGTRDDETRDLTEWLNSGDIFKKRLSLRAGSIVLSIITIIIIILVITGLPTALLGLALSLNTAFYFSQAKKINRLHQQVSRSSGFLRTYSDIIDLLEKKEFRSPKLRTLQSVFTGEVKASERVRKLAGLVNSFDRRMNILVSIPLNLLFFTDIHLSLALERWKNESGDNIRGWFGAMAEFEVLSSLANMAFNNPTWVKPEILTDYFTLRAVDMGHPLITGRRCVSNDIDITGSGRSVIITGSNMSGKSTFLRSCGVNMVLAFAGAHVRASSFSVSHVHLFSSMRISDSLEDNTSSFYAELKRLAAIIKEAEVNPRLFLLLDEILRGTNSNDRYTGSVALIKQLTDYGTVAVVATHDLRLTELTSLLPGKIDNYHFDVKISGEELFFDYKLTSGICQSLNASILMKKMGIKI